VATTYPSTAGLFAGAPECIGGAAFVSHSINYNNWLPTLTARYRVAGPWSVYAQFAEGSVIPPSSVFAFPRKESPPVPPTLRTADCRTSTGCPE